jgi:hypothetical protein
MEDPGEAGLFQFAKEAFHNGQQKQVCAGLFLIKPMPPGTVN